MLQIAPIFWTAPMALCNVLDFDRLCTAGIRGLVVMMVRFREVWAAARPVDWFKRLRLWVSALIRWAWEPTEFWLLFSGTIVAGVLAVLLFSCREQQFRFFGMGLQLLGVATVVLKVLAANRQFPWQAKTQWWKRWPRFWAKHHILSAVGTSEARAVVAGRGRAVLGPESSLQDRVTRLEQNYVSLFDEVGALGQELKKKTDELSISLKTEHAAREEGDKENEEQLKEAVVGSFHLDLWGVVFFALGIFVGTISSEIASFVGAAPCK